MADMWSDRGQNQDDILEHLPNQGQTVYVENTNYYYSNGAYYEKKPAEKEGEEPSFEVAKPPIGASVSELPKDAKKETIGGSDYFVYDGTYYTPFYSGSNVVYMVTADPTA